MGNHLHAVFVSVSCVLSSPSPILLLPPVADVAYTFYNLRPAEPLEVTLPFETDEGEGVGEGGEEGEEGGDAVRAVVTHEEGEGDTTSTIMGGKKRPLEVTHPSPFHLLTHSPSTSSLPLHYRTQRWPLVRKD